MGLGWDVIGGDRDVQGGDGIKGGVYVRSQDGCVGGRMRRGRVGYGWRFEVLAVGAGCGDLWCLGWG